MSAMTSFGMPFFSGGAAVEAWDFAEGLELLANDAASSSGSSPLSFSAVQFAEPARCTVYIWSTSGEEDFHGESHGTRNVVVQKYFSSLRPLQHGTLVTVCHSTPDVFVPSQFHLGGTRLRHAHLSTLARSSGETPSPSRGRCTRDGMGMPAQWVARLNKKWMSVGSNALSLSIRSRKAASSPEAVRSPRSSRWKRVRATSSSPDDVQHVPWDPARDRSMCDFKFSFLSVFKLGRPQGLGRSSRGILS